jgi:hypothetical protein
VGYFLNKYIIRSNSKMANLKLLGAVSGYTELAAADNAVPTVFVLPAADGTVGQVLSTNGNGTLQFTTVQAGGASYTLPIASTTILGGVRVDGTSITINGSGVISGASTYTLPTASSTVLGGVKVGNGLEIVSGVLSATGTATATQSDSLKVGANYRQAAIDEASQGTAYTIACRDLDGNLNAVFFQGTATSSLFADLAERYTADATYAPGTVLEFGGSHEVTIAQDDTRRVAGVVSSHPGFIMNNALIGAHVATVALQGRVPCKVRGTIRKGDMLVSAGGGFARPTQTPQVGSVIGKALEDFDGAEGVIEVVVGRL